MLRIPIGVGIAPSGARAGQQFEKLRTSSSPSMRTGVDRLNDFITPDEAQRLLSAHHREPKAHKVRLAICGALRAGVLEWHCDDWLEELVHEDGARFDAAGGWTNEVPKGGWPNDFWIPTLALVGAELQWLENQFTVRDTVTSLDVSREVGAWISNHGEGFAERLRKARGVTVCLADIFTLLGRPGWKEFGRKSDGPAPAKRVASHYRAALVRLVARAAVDPLAMRNNLAAEVRAAFSPDLVPEKSDLAKLVAEIRRHIASFDDDSIAPAD